MCEIEYNGAIIIRGVVEDTVLEAKDTKKSEANAKNRLSEDRPSRDQGQECSRPRPRTKNTTRKCFPNSKKRSWNKNIENFCDNLSVFKKKKEKSLRTKNCKFSRKFRRPPKQTNTKKKVFVKFQQGLWRAPRRNTNMVMTLAHLQQIKK